MTAEEAVAELTRLGEEAGDYGNPPEALAIRSALESSLEALDEYESDITVALVQVGVTAEEKASYENRAKMMRTVRARAMTALTLLSVLASGKKTGATREALTERLDGLLRDLAIRTGGEG